ncbi:MAG: chemotaxis protein CheX [Desulfococcaceae bacterium]|jgi:chemotaxis protein CheX|nr:chemotaxis protein CheX [Desulfococcaceae bacterium]
MTALDNLKVREVVTGGMSETFEMMLSMSIEPCQADPDNQISGERIVGSVGFAGDVVGNIRIHVSKVFGRTVAAAMLGMDEDELEGDQDVGEVIGELSNIIGGNLISMLSNRGFPCRLSIPTITIGSDYRIESMGNAHVERFHFRSGENNVLVELIMKQNPQ